jgi:hypothetical protein
MYPDHPEANKLGCKCPVHYGNNKGDGTVIDGVRSFTVNPQCPVHADWRWWTRKPPAAAS